MTLPTNYANGNAIYASDFNAITTEVNALASAIVSGNVVVGGSGNLTISGSSPATIDLSSSVNLAGTYTVAEAFTAKNTVALWGAVTVGTTAENQFVITPGTAGVTVSNTGTGSFLIENTASAGLVSLVAGGGTAGAQGIAFLSASSGATLYPMAANGAANALTQTNDVVVATTGTIGLVLAPSASYGLRLDHAGAHAIDATTLSLAGALAVTGVESAPFLWTNSSGLLQIGTVGTGLTFSGGTLNAGAISVSVAAPVTNTSGTIGLRIGGSGNVVTTGGSLDLNQTVSLTGPLTTSLVIAGTTAENRIVLSPGTSTSSTALIEAMGSGLLNITGSTVEVNGSPIISAAGLSAALVTLITNLGTVPVSGTATLWSNGGVLTYS